MFDDLLGDKKKYNEQTKDSIIEAMQANIEQKEKIISDLFNRITEIERKLEDVLQEGVGYI